MPPRLDPEDTWRLWLGVLVARVAGAADRMAWFGPMPWQAVIQEQAATVDAAAYLAAAWAAAPQGR